MKNTFIHQNDDGYSKKELLEIIEDIDADQRHMEHQTENKTEKTITPSVVPKGSPR